MNSEIAIVRSSRHDWFVLLLLGISLSGNVLLGTAFLRLTSQMAAPTAANQAKAPAGPAIGTRLPPLEAGRLGGTRETLTFSETERPTVVYVFTPTCQWCERNYENLRATLAAAKQSHRVVALSLDPNVGAGAYMDLGVPIYVNPSAGTVKAYQLGPTPETIVLSPKGEVVRSWMGAYSAKIQDEVETYFSISLPGLVMPGQTDGQSRIGTGQGGSR